MKAGSAEHRAWLAGEIDMDITEAEEAEGRLEEALDDLFELINDYKPWDAEGRFAQRATLDAIEKITFEQFIIRGN